MSVSIDALRKIAELDPSDTMIRYALGRKLFEEVLSPQGQQEAADHLRFVRENDRRNIAAWHTLAQVLVELGETAEAVETLNEGLKLIAADPAIDGTDLAPEMEALLESLDEE